MGDNPNTIPLMTTWSKVFQITRFKGLAYKAFASQRLESQLEKGNKVKRTYASTGRAKSMGNDGSYSKRALVNTEEELEINLKDEYSYTLVEWENYLRHMPDQQKYSQIASRELMRKVDARTLGSLYAGAGSYVDDGDLGGSAGTSITPSATNVADIFIQSGMKLRLKNAYFDPQMKYEGGVVQPGMPAAAISPQVYAKLISYLGGKTTALGDVVSQNGHGGKFDIFNIFVSNNLPATCVITMATIPSNTQNLVINGVTIQFLDTLAATDGAVHITSAVDSTRANLAAHLNNPYASETEATNAGYVAFTQAQADLLDGIIATNDNTADTLTIQMDGWNSFAAPTTTVTGATVGAVTQHCIFGVSESIDLVMKKNPGLTIKDTPSTVVSKDFIHWDLYGEKVFADQAPGIVDVRVATSGFTQPTMP